MDERTKFFRLSLSLSRRTNYSANEERGKKNVRAGQRTASQIGWTNKPNNDAFRIDLPVFPPFSPTPSFNSSLSFLAVARPFPPLFLPFHSLHVRQTRFGCISGVQLQSRNAPLLRHVISTKTRNTYRLGRREREAGIFFFFPGKTRKLDESENSPPSKFGRCLGRWWILTLVSSWFCFSFGERRGKESRC